MSSAGHIIDMIRRNEQNLGKRKRRRPGKRPYRHFVSGDGKGISLRQDRERKEAILWLKILGGLIFLGASAVLVYVLIS